MLVEIADHRDPGPWPLRPRPSSLPCSGFLRFLLRGSELVMWTGCVHATTYVLFGHSQAVFPRVSCTCMWPRDSLLPWPVGQEQKYVPLLRLSPTQFPHAPLCWPAPLAG